MNGGGFIVVDGFKIVGIVDWCGYWFFDYVGCRVWVILLCRVLGYFGKIIVLVSGFWVMFVSWEWGVLIG